MVHDLHSLRFGWHGATARVAAVIGVACSSLMWGQATTSAQPQEAENICLGLSVPYGKSAELYFKTPDGIIKPFDSAYLSEIVGRRVSFCYVAKRTPEDVPYGVPQRGAINPKVELYQPNGSSQVLLYNNHLDASRLCKARDYTAYQTFHQFRTDDPCLNSGFHNDPSDFGTLQDGRRFVFLFPSFSLFERFWLPGETAPVKRMSYIYNYVVPQDFSPIRVPFHFTTGAKMTAMRIVLDDLLETGAGRPLDSIRIIK